DYYCTSFADSNSVSF
nr:immunoglobulin light chain junction region [Macaca mulatta]